MDRTFSLALARPTDKWPRRIAAYASAGHLACRIRRREGRRMTKADLALLDQFAAGLRAEETLRSAAGVAERKQPQDSSELLRVLEALGPVVAPDFTEI